MTNKRLDQLEYQNSDKPPKKGDLCYYMNSSAHLLEDSYTKKYYFTLLEKKMIRGNTVTGLCLEPEASQFMFIVGYTFGDRDSYNVCTMIYLEKSGDQK